MNVVFNVKYKISLIGMGSPLYEGSLMVRWVVGSILHRGPIELFLVSASAPRLVQQRPWYVLSCLWDGAYKRTHAANRKE